jgi:site-specific recombinase XerD
MAYDYRPNAARAATTDPTIAAHRPRPKFETPSWTPVVPAISVAAVIEEFIDEAEAGRALDRYRPTALRNLSSTLRNEVAVEFGEMGIDEVGRGDVQALVDALDESGAAPSHTRSVANAVRALYAHAIEQGYVARNPADELILPRDGGDPERDRERDDYQPIALLPERILSLVLRIVVVLFVLFALVTIAGSA